MKLEIKNRINKTKKDRLSFIKKMSLNKKIFYYFLIQAFVVFILVCVMAQKIIVTNIVKLEDKRMYEEISRIIYELDNQLESIKQIVHDYSVWDDTYDYVTHKLNNDETFNWRNFEKDNLSGISMQSTDLSLIMVLDNDANVIYELGYNGTVQGGINIAREIKDIVAKKEFVNSLTEFNEKIGIIDTEEGLFFVVAHPILNNLAQGPKNGTMVMARALDKDYILRLVPNFNIKLAQNSDSNKISSSDENKLNTKNFDSPYIDIETDIGVTPSIRANGYIEDITGKKVYKIELDTSKSGLEKNIKMNRCLFLGIFLLYILMSGTTWYFLYDNFIYRINHILKSISRLKNNAIGSNYNELETDDELEIVEKKIDVLVQELNSHYEEIMHNINTDGLTKLYNRVGFSNEIKQYINSIPKNQIKSVILFLDIDKFKNINDVYGHSVGDEVLKEFSNRISTYSPATSIVSRTSGDEFIIFIKEYETKEKINQLVSTLIEHLNEPYYIQNYSIKSTASIGMAFYPEDSNDIDEIIVQADAAMYKVKKNGRNSFIEYSSEMKNFITGISIIKGIKNKEFYLEYQPQINSKNGNLEGVETLLRWKNPILGYIPPDKFISIAQDTGTINELGEYVLDEVCQQVKKWEDKGYEIPNISINISPLQLINRNFHKDVLEILNKYNLNTKNIIFEITENLAMSSEEQIYDNLICLHKYGIRIYIDDFGKGYSAFSYLEELPISGVKIDKSFVDQVETNDKIVRMVLALSKALNIKVVVEGVETEIQKEKVCSIGGCIIQGHFYSKPLRVEVFERKYLILN